VFGLVGVCRTVTTASTDAPLPGQARSVAGGRDDQRGGREGHGGGGGLADGHIDSRAAAPVTETAVAAAVLVRQYCQGFHSCGWVCPLKEFRTVSCANTRKFKGRFMIVHG